MNVSPIQRIGIACMVALGLLIGSAASAGETGSGYSWTEIIIPSIGPVGAGGINDKGQVVVQSPDGSKAGIYRNGVFTPLPALPAGYKFNLVWGINNNGTVVGGVYAPTDPTHEQGFILVGSKYTFFSRPGWNNTEARAIANSGLITGYSYTDDVSATAGFVYNPATGTFTDATPPGSGTGFSVTQGMNAAGRITGDGRLPDGTGRYGFIWQQGTLVKGTHELAPFLAQVRIEEAGTAARGINDAGFVVGFTNTGLGFVGSDSRGFELLVPPGGDAPGNSVVCEGINNFGQVVCGVSDVNGNTVGEFIGTPGMTDQQ